MTTTSDTPGVKRGIYLGVSTNREDDGNQLEQLREISCRQGWAIAVE